MPPVQVANCRARRLSKSGLWQSVTLKGHVRLVRDQDLALGDWDFTGSW